MSDEARVIQLMIKDMMHTVGYPQKPITKRRGYRVYSMWRNYYMGNSKGLEHAFDLGLCDRKIGETHPWYKVNKEGIKFLEQILCCEIRQES